MRELKTQEVESIGGGVNPYLAFVAGAALSSQIGRMTNYVVDDIIAGFQAPIVRHPHQNGRAF
ncbi:hypothetical protein [Marinobacter xestospongiae]|uniref:Class IIb bacteriocin, lactobin A/cerein 7B family n=1 Tax=Marinobacter xestospongiae TaxID=994319 RepID=A0ABU3VV52_9GAMM|nr:hypothetical protein [Marinobacter xestospongiae]MDV2078149.1 hypothetical protein [Marinobacter xestospongiae]